MNPDNLSCYSWYYLYHTNGVDECIKFDHWIVLIKTNLNRGDQQHLINSDHFLSIFSIDLCFSFRIENVFLLKSCQFHTHLFLTITNVTFILFLQRKCWFFSFFEWLGNPIQVKKKTVRFIFYCIFNTIIRWSSLFLDWKTLQSI